MELLPEGIVITISAAMIKEKKYRNWLRNFLTCMASEQCSYWMRQGTRPKRDVLFVYLCIGNKVRFRANFVVAEGPGEKTFDDGRVMFGKAWIVLCGPVVRPDVEVPMKGFRGFRYCEKLF
jgi:hypothetical protein